jgi:hypothetical protein
LQNNFKFLILKIFFDLIIIFFKFTTSLIIKLDFRIRIRIAERMIQSSKFQEKFKNNYIILKIKIFIIFTHNFFFFLLTYIYLYF